MAGLVLNVELSPTIEKFVWSRAFYNVCCSPRGGGKTSGGLFRVLHHAQSYKKWVEQQGQVYRPLTWAVVRDTRKNLGLTTARTIKEWCPEPHSLWRGKPEEPERCTIKINNKPLTIFDFFGVNSPTDLDRFQSYEASGGVWIEEPCPAATNTEYISSGIAEAVLAMAVTSVRGAPFPSVQLTFNPPSADHWTAQLWQLPGFDAMGDIEAEMPEQQRRDREAIRQESAIFMVPPTENAAEKKTPGYSERNRQILSATGRTDMLARLVEGRVGYAQMGEKVTPAFSSAHISHALQVIPNIPMIFLYDFGLYPSCLACQISPQGYWIIHKAWSVPNIGMKQLMELHVQPWYVQQPVADCWHGGGPEGVERDQSDSERTAVKEIVRAIPGPYRPGPVAWSTRRDAMDEALNRFYGGMPWVRISAEGAAKLIRSLDGGWSYPVDALGHVRREKPDKKNQWGHIGDAFGHGCCLLLKKTDQQSRSLPRRLPPSRHLSTHISTYTRGSRTGL